MKYRICPENSKRVEAFHDGIWMTAYYCGSPEGARDCLEKCNKRIEAWLEMSDEERMQSILRGSTKIFTCFKCGHNIPVANPDNPKESLCDVCCGNHEDGHDYDYDRSRRSRFCRRCDKEVDQDYYDE